MGNHKKSSHFHRRLARTFFFSVRPTALSTRPKEELRPRLRYESQRALWGETERNDEEKRRKNCKRATRSQTS